MGKTKKVKHKKFSLTDFVWMGFNYTVGIGFIGNFAILSNIGSWTKNASGLYVWQSNPDSIGMHVIWLFVIEGLVAGICAWAFAKMARVHKSDNNGAAYIYTRSSFGRFWGFFVAFIQYVSLPFLIALQIMMLMKGTFDRDYVSDSSLAVDWGSFTGLFLDLIGIAIYLAAACVIFGGMFLYKRTSNYAGIIKWVTAGVLILAGLYLAFKNGSSSMAFWTDSSAGGGNHFSLNGFVKAFNSCFFFFAGFETFSTAGRNIENPEKNIGRGIMLIIIISTVFYIIISIIFFAAFASFEQNMNIGTWNAFAAIRWLELAGGIIMVISGLSLKIQVAMMNALYGGTSLQPLAKEGYFSDRFRKLNKDNLPVRASMLNMGITAIMIVLWLIIPDLIKGINPNFNAFDVSMFTEASSAITIFIYAIVIIVTLKLGAQKKIRIKLWEWIAFCIVFVFLAFMFVMHYKDVVEKLLSADNWLAGTIEIIFVVVSVLFIVIWYFAYYVPKYQKRLQKHPEIQARLEKEFEIEDDWSYVSRELRAELDGYLVRNYALHKNHINENYLEAKKMFDNLDLVVAKYNQMENEEKAHEDEHIDE